MQEFKDAKGQTRRIELNVFTVERVRSSVTFQDGTPVNLFAIADEQIEAEMRTPGQLYPDRQNTMQRITSDPVVLCQILHAIMDCDFDEFAQAMNGDAIAAATDAFMLEIVQLFPPSRRPAMLEVYTKGKELEQRISDKALQAVRSQTFANYLDREFQQFDKRFGALLDVSASTPAPSP